MPNLEEIMDNVHIAYLWENMNIHEYNSIYVGLYVNILRFYDTLNNVFIPFKEGEMGNTALANLLVFTS